MSHRFVRVDVPVHGRDRAIACSAAVPDRGGRVLQAGHPIARHDRRAVVIDSEGHRVALHSPTH
jgi:predicted enzyme related to lactoylglutathione lyase